MSFRLGCAIWAYRGWLGDFFPEGSANAELLKLYGDRLTTVECNATFYAVPSSATVERWRQEVPEGFRFCPKLPQAITHRGLLAPNLKAVHSFIELMQGLGDRLGPIFAQLPPSYGPQQFKDLEAFLADLVTSDAALAVEVRHPQWFTDNHRDRLNTLLDQHQIGRVILDTRPIYRCSDNPQVNSERKKPNVPVQPVATAPFSLIRYISHPDRDFNQRFMKTWIPVLRDWLAQGTEVFFFIHCPIEEHSPTNLRYFQQLLQAEDLPIPDLPWDNIEKPADQLSLF